MCNKCEEIKKNATEEGVEPAEAVAEPAEEAVQDTEEVVAEPVANEAAEEEQHEDPVEEPEAVTEGFLNASECAEEILKARENELEGNLQAVRKILLDAVKQARVNGMDATSLVEMQAKIPAMLKSEVPPMIQREMAEAGWELIDGYKGLVIRPLDKAIYQRELDLENRYKK